jgi:hypothetical protein
VVAAPVTAPEEPRQAINQAEARTVPGTMGDPLRAVQSLPGVARAPYGMGLLVVRGASPADSGVFLDGVQLPALYHFLVGPSVLTTHLIDQIDFAPGGFGVEHGPHHRRRHRRHRPPGRRRPACTARPRPVPSTPRCSSRAPSPAAPPWPSAPGAAPSI